VQRLEIHTRKEKEHKESKEKTTGTSFDFTDSMLRFKEKTFIIFL
jgi:hypothetical protein